MPDFSPFLFEGKEKIGAGFLVTKNKIVSTQIAFFLYQATILFSIASIKNATNLSNYTERILGIFSC